MSLPFTELYRPKSREEIVGNKDTIDKIFALADNDNFPHMIFEGIPGNGKTSTAIVLARKLFGEYMGSNFEELNASDERGIDVVRDSIKTFAKTTPFNAKFKIMFLDEFDLTAEAQQALRRTLERYSDITKFIISTNYLEKIIDPIQSRCEVFKFGPLSVEDISARLIEIFRLEVKRYVPPEEYDALKKVAELAHGDMRRALNHLQLLLSLGKSLTVDIVESMKPMDFGKLIYDSISQGHFLEARQSLQKALELGYTERYLIDLLHKVYIGESIDYSIKARAVFALCETDFRLTQGVNALLVMDNLLYKLMEYHKK
jgi:replication factor C small subunit